MVTLLSMTSCRTDDAEEDQLTADPNHPIGPLVVAESGGSRITKPSRLENDEWTVTFGSIICTQDGSPVRLTDVTYDTAVTPAGLLTRVRSSEMSRDTPAIGSIHGRVEQLPGSLSEVDGTEVAVPCRSTDRYVEILTEVTAGPSGASLTSFDIAYEASGEDYVVTVPWTIEMCGSRVREEPCT